VKVTLGERFKSFGMFPDVGKLTDMFNEKFDALIAKLDEILTELKKQNAGQFGLVVGIVIVVLALAIIGLFAVCTPGENDHSLGRVQLVRYDGGGDGGCWDGECYDGDGQDQRYDQNYGSRDDRNRSRNRNRGAFSPGPFDRSPVDAFNGNTVCLPGSTCNVEDRRQPKEDEPK